MIQKSSERIQKKATIQINNLANSMQINGEKRLKSLDSRTSIQNRHLYSYQIYSKKADRITGSSSTVPTQAQGDRLMDISRANIDQQDRISTIGDHKERRYVSEGGEIMMDSQFIHQREGSQGNNINKKKQKKNQTMQVFVRVRPLNQKELTGKNGIRKTIKVCEDRKQIIINSTECNKSVFSQNVREDKLFEMNRAFGEESSNEEVFDIIMKDDINGSLFEGFNCTCFVYGMTGAGKTYTMFGDICNYMTMNSSVQGLIMLSLKEIMNIVKEKIEQNNKTNDENNEINNEENTEENSKKQITFRLKISYLEIYNEQIRDLLSVDCANNDNLMVIEDPNKGVFVPDLIEQEIISQEQVLDLIRIGNTRRQMAATGQNEFSSRSHAIITFQIQQTIQTKIPQTKNEYENTITNNKATVITSKLCLVDLAGSERASANDNRGVRFQEGANINRSLLALGNCINILADTTKKGAFVPYRDSKLTRLLKDSLGGNTQTYMVACVSPAFVSFEETLNTLKYAQRARKIQKIVTKNEKIIPGLSSSKSLQYITLIETMKKEIDLLKLQLANTTGGQQNQSNINFSLESQLYQYNQHGEGQMQLYQKSSNQISSESELYQQTQQPQNYYSNNIETNRSQFLPNDVSSVQLQLHDSVSSTDQKQMSGWQEGDSFSSSGKSVRISCSNTLNNSSVILFKRSPSQINFTKQQQITQQNINEEMQLITSRILKNLEENWEIQQSIQDLNNLKKQNEDILEEKKQKVKKLKGNLIQWPHENEINLLSTEITQLQNTMNNNQMILENMNQALIRNEDNKVDLQQQMVILFENNSEQIIKAMSQTCNTLQTEKNDLENTNLEMKQQQLQIQSQFQEKVHQIKNMEKQILQMQQQLQEKDQIIQQNQETIMQLTSSNTLPSQKLPSYNTSSINTTQQYNQNSIYQPQNGRISGQIGSGIPNNILNTFNSQPSITSCPFNASSFFLTTVTNNGNATNNFNPFLSQADQNSQAESKVQIDQQFAEANGDNEKKKKSALQTISNQNGIKQSNNFVQQDNYQLNKPAISQLTGQNGNNMLQETKSYNTYNSNSILGNLSTIQLATTSAAFDPTKEKDTKRQLSSDSNNYNSSKLQIQMQNNNGGNLNQSNIFRSTSSTNNKKFFQEKNGYFDFKIKQSQIFLNQNSSLATPSVSTNIGLNSQQNLKGSLIMQNQNSKNTTYQAQNKLMASTTGNLRNNPASPQMRLSSPNQMSKAVANSNIQNKKPIGVINGNLNPESSTTAITTSNLTNQQQNLQQQSLSSSSQTTSRQQIAYKSPTSITSSTVNKKSVQTHRDKQLNVKNNSSGGTSTISSTTNNTSSMYPISSSGKVNGINNYNDINSVEKNGGNSQLSSNNNISQINGQNYNINTNNNSCNDYYGTNKLQNARNEYKEFINIFKKIQKDDEDSTNVSSNIVQYTTDEKLQYTDKQQIKPQKEFDLYPNQSSLYQSKGCKYITADLTTTNKNNIKPFIPPQSLDSRPLSNRNSPNQNFLDNYQIKNTFNNTSNGFLQTEEFPEYQSIIKNNGGDRIASYDRLSAINKNQQESQIKDFSSLAGYSGITQVLTASQVQQNPLKEHTSPQNNPIKTPYQANINLYASSHQQSHSTPPLNHNTTSASSLNKFSSNLQTSVHRRNDSIIKALQAQSNYKDSNIITPDYSLNLNKIDLYQDKDRITPLGHYSSAHGTQTFSSTADKVQDTSSILMPRNNIQLYQELHRLNQLLLMNNTSSSTVNEIQIFLEQIKSPIHPPLILGSNEQAAVERFKSFVNEQNLKSERPPSQQKLGSIQSYLQMSQQRVKSLGKQSKTEIVK